MDQETLMLMGLLPPQENLTPVPMMMQAPGMPQPQVSQSVKQKRRVQQPMLDPQILQAMGNPQSPQGFPQSTDALQQAILSRQAQALEEQKAGIKNQEQALSQMQGVSPWIAAASAVSDIMGNTRGATQNAVNQQQMQQMQQLMAQQRLQGSRSDLARNEIDYLEAMMRPQIRQDEMEMRERIAQIAANSRQDLRDTGPTEAEKVFDREAAKDIQPWYTGGKREEFQSQLGVLQNALSYLKENPTATGGKYYATPDTLKPMLFPKTRAIQGDIERVVTQGLRETLGAQFTEREAQQFLRRVFDPGLPAAETSIRLEREIEKLRQKAALRDRTAKYYQENRTFRGIPFEIQSGEDAGGVAPAPVSGTDRDAKLKRLQELEAKARGN
jgi:hypothetical protein